MAYASTEQALFGAAPELIGRRLDDLRRRGVEPLVTLDQVGGAGHAQAAFFGNDRTVGARLGYVRANYTRVFYVQSGGGRIHVGRRAVTLERGDLLLIPPFHRASSRDFRPTRASCRATHFWYFGFKAGPGVLSDGNGQANDFWPVDPLAAFPAIEGTEARLGVIPAPAQAMWVDQCEELAAEMNGIAPGRQAKIHALSTLMVVEARRFNAASRATLVPNDSVTLGIFRYINANAHRSISVEEIAAAIGRSCAYIRDLVRRETGRTLNDWIDERRMRQAARRLIRTGEEAELSTFRFGADDYAHFSAKFRAWSGKSPEEFRKMYRGAYSTRTADTVFTLRELLQTER